MADLPDPQAVNSDKISCHSGDGRHSPKMQHSKFLVPSPIPTRRNRTFSQSERAAQGDTYSGKVKEFCRYKGHGYIVADETNECIFVHISDIEGEFVPKEGDDVTFKLCPLPFNPHKKQAVHVHIKHLAPGVTHETWNASPEFSSPAHTLTPS